MRWRRLIALAFGAGLGLTVEARAQVFEPSMAAWFTGLQASISSIRVDTRQDSLGAEQGSVADANAAMGLASVIVEQEAVVAARDAVARFESMHNDPTHGALHDGRWTAKRPAGGKGSSHCGRGA